MSCGGSQDQQNSSALSTELKQWSQEENQEIKLLLLGTGASGKSTFFKQMRLIHANGYSENDKLGFKPVILNNIKDIFISTLVASEKFGNAIGESLKDICDALLKEKLNTEPFPFTPSLAKDLETLWKDEGFQKTLLKRNEYDLLDSAEYYVSRMEEIAKEGYVPSVDDILRSRSKTVGIMTQRIEVMQENKRKQKFLFVDVGGQRNERKKWIHAFDAVTAVIFLCSLSEYDQVLEEDKQQNRIQEAISLFKTVCEEKAFKTVSFILFYNKDDLFREKIKKVDPALNPSFSDYKGGCDYDKALDYFQKKFKAQNLDKGRSVQEHTTTATDTQGIKKVFDSCKAIIIRQLLKKSGF